MLVRNILYRVLKRCLSIQLLQKCNPFTLELRGYHHYVLSSLSETCFPLLKSRDICISSCRYQNDSGTFKLSLLLSESRVPEPVVTQRLYRFNHGLKFWECPIHRRITQAYLMSEYIICCLKRFGDISVTLFPLNTQPDISDWVV